MEKGKRLVVEGEEEAKRMVGKVVESEARITLQLKGKAGEEG